MFCFRFRCHKSSCICDFYAAIITKAWNQAGRWHNSGKEPPENKQWHLLFFFYISIHLVESSTVNLAIAIISGILSKLFVVTYIGCTDNSRNYDIQTNIKRKCMCVRTSQPTSQPARQRETERKHWNVDIESDSEFIAKYDV